MVEVVSIIPRPIIAIMVDEDFPTDAHVGLQDLMHHGVIEVVGNDVVEVIPGVREVNVHRILGIKPDLAGYSGRLSEHDA